MVVVLLDGARGDAGVSAATGGDAEDAIALERAAPIAERRDLAALNDIGAHRAYAQDGVLRLLVIHAAHDSPELPDAGIRGESELDDRHVLVPVGDDRAAATYYVNWHRDLRAPITRQLTRLLQAMGAEIPS